MQSKSRELLWALIAIAFITVMYLFVQVIYRRTPAAGSLYGHSMGIVGFLLMLMTETLYTLRKRSRQARWGKMSSWLEFHIFTGLVGPYLVLLHTAWVFQGLAGLVMLLTILVVASGFIGRYIYTSVPRSPAGEELSVEELELLVRQTETNLAHLQRGGSRLGEVMPINLPVQSGTGLVLGRVWIELRETVSGWTEGRGADARARERAKTLADLRRRKNRLQRQIASLAAARRLLSIWHALHIPIGLTLFLMAFLHIFAAIYFAHILW
jgi:hypothetical protein